MVLDISLINTLHYEVRIKDKVERSREGVVAIEKWAFGSPSTTVANLTHFTRWLKTFDFSDVS